MSSQPSIPRPFPGIRPFEETDSPIFFGREAQVNDLITKLEASRFVAVVGSSGSGKSSMVKAGLLPTLKLGLLRDVDEWHSLVIRAGSHPFRCLAEQILRRHVGLAETQDLSQEQSLRVEGLAVELRKCPGGLGEVLRQFEWPPHVHFAFVVDQFEEIFGFRSLSNTIPAVSRDDVERLVQLLLKTAAVPVLSPFATTPAPEPHSAADLGTRVWTVLTMRSDFIGQCEVFPALAEAVSNSQFLVPVLDEHQKEDAIRRPGQSIPGAAYPPFEVDPALVRMIINDSGDQMDQLPLMQHSLMRTWAKASQRWKAEGAGDKATSSSASTSSSSSTSANPAKGARLILPADYVPLNEALDQHAEDAWKAVSQQPAQKALSKPFFLSLCDWSQDGAIIRRRPTVENVLALTGATQADLEAVIRTFQEDERNFILPILTGDSAHRLLPTDVLDISHEAFLRQWKTYRIWQEESRKDIAELRDLCRRSQLFLENPIRVLSKEDLDTFKKWKATKTETWAQRYVPKEDWPAWQGVEKLFTASQKNLDFAERYKRAYAIAAVGFIFGGLLIAAVAAGLALSMAKSANDKEQEAINRTTLSLRRLVGTDTPDGSIFPDEDAALWDIAELDPESELVREDLLAYWFARDSQFSLGSKASGDGIGTATGLSLELHQRASRWAQDLAGKLAAQGSEDLGNREHSWQYLGQFLEADALHKLLTLVIEKVEKDDAADTTGEDLCMVIKLITARPDAATSSVKSDLTRAAALMIKAVKSANWGDSIFDQSAGVFAAVATKMDAADAGKLGEQLVEVLEGIQTPEDEEMKSFPDPSFAVAGGLASLLERLDAERAAPLGKRAVAHLLETLNASHDPYYYARLGPPLTALMRDLDASSAALLAEQLLKKLEDPKITGVSYRQNLAYASCILIGRLDAAAVSLAQRTAVQVLALLKHPSQDYSDPSRGLAEMLDGLFSKLDAGTAASLAQQGADSFVQVMEQDPSLGGRQDVAALGLEGLAGKLDAAAADPLAKRLVQRSEDSLHPEFRSHAMSALETLAARLDASAAAPLAKQLLGDSLPPDADQTAALASLLERLDAPTAAALAKIQADKLIATIKALDPNNFENRVALVQVLQTVLPMMDPRAAAPLAQQAADQWTKALMRTPSGYVDSTAHFAQSLTSLTVRLDAVAITSLAEQSLQALEQTSLTVLPRLHRCARTTEGLAANLDASNSPVIHRRLLAVLLGKLEKGVNENKTKGTGENDKMETAAKELAEYFCRSALVLPPKEKQVLLLYALQSKLAYRVSSMGDMQNPTVEDADRRITREALSELDVPTLANILKWPQCRGEARTLVLQALEQKTGQQFHGDLWQFVTFAASNCTPGVDLDGPVHRISLEDMLKAVSSALNLTAAKP